jgi:hypothetical protein
VREAHFRGSHAKQFRAQRPQVGLDEFSADGRILPRAVYPVCLVAACTRPADGAWGYINTHYQRWRVALR